jgi:chitodextrinase
VNSVGEGARSNERSATTPSSGDVVAPSTPTNMTTLLSGTTQVVIDWTNSNDNVGVTGYQVYRDGSLVTTTSSSWFADSGLGAGTSHTYQIRAVDAAGNRSAASIVLSASTIGLANGVTGVLSGVVFDEDGDVISNAIVRINGTTKSTRTNRNGVYTFAMIFPGSYGVTATYTGSATVTMTAIAKQTVVAAISLPS